MKLKKTTYLLKHLKFITFCIKTFDTGVSFIELPNSDFIKNN
ncbi:MAG: hypothetical protein V5787_03135 [Flavicella sp.]